jgi:hypothetical protein
MSASRINEWLTLVANFGVVVGLGLLIFEVNQATKLAEVAAYVDRLEQIQQSRVDFANSDYLPPIRTKALAEGVQSLSTVELSRLANWERGVRARMDSHYHQFLQGYLDQESAGTMLASAADILPLWEALGFELTDSEFHQAIRRAAGR